MPILPKRGDVGLETVGKLVLGSIALVAILFVLYSLFQEGNQQSNNPLGCRLSVEANAQSKTGTGGHLLSYGTQQKGETTAEVECPPQFHVVKDIKEEGEINSFVAREMAECYWKFGEGELNPFSDIDASGRDHNRVCAVCSVVQFDEGVKKDHPSVRGLMKYLSEKSPPYTEKYSSYVEYFTKNSLPKAEEEKLVSNDVQISTGSDYAVLFIVDKYSEDAGTFWEWFNTGSIVPAGGAASVTVLVGGIVLIPLAPQLGISATVGSVAFRALGIGLGTGAVFGQKFSKEYKDKFSVGVVVVPYDEESLASRCDTLGVDPYEHWFIEK